MDILIKHLFSEGWGDSHTEGRGCSSYFFRVKKRDLVSVKASSLKGPCGTFKGMGLKKKSVSSIFFFCFRLLKGENNSSHAHKTGS